MKPSACLEHLIEDWLVASAGNDAYIKWRELTGSPANANSVREFYNFLGIGEHTNKHDAWKAANLSPTARERIRWLNGPDAEIFYRIWKARNVE